MPVKEDFEHCVMHAGSDKIHKLKVGRELAPGRPIVNRTQTRCGALTTHMGDISAKRVLELPESLRCERCFQ